jgi:hypothetical protein
VVQTELQIDHGRARVRILSSRVQATIIYLGRRFALPRHKTQNIAEPYDIAIIGADPIGSTAALIPELAHDFGFWTGLTL